MIVFEDVSYTYQQRTPYEFQALNLVTTTFEQGRYYAIIGKTGSGKSTLIQHLNGLLKPSRGKLQILDVPVTRKTKDKTLQKVRKRIGMVFQFPESQLFEQTVEHEILFGPKNFGLDLTKARQKAVSLLEKLNLDAEEMMKQSPFLLSGGQMRKVALVAILAMDPDILVLDEPTAGLDPKSKRQVMQLFKEIQVKEHKTIILVTHDMNDVAAYADEVKVMSKGRVMSSQTPEQLFRDTAYVQSLHLDLPDIVQLQRDLEDRLHIQFDRLAMTEAQFAEMYKAWRDEHER
ncbi:MULTISPECIES: energy-coupling factor transporter ATPase [unclassified Staphylococcus]|uniref:energy-coupling factor transporter ATPase n=1 Tax=unclassified Staphylococcus TaxID=91994 RepID=UPI0021D1D5A9|nr:MULTISPECIES: energy-coupling factor transporter ATPase [unclassified Staphylococcus]UXR77960.1 energy-coupling factor transporter ATPase [Staphylococcus sp. IVB6227]UXR82121.1 energy-coupling factor transporter ATPase [Staphylococcus sp. IVB6214]